VISGDSALDAKPGSHGSSQPDGVHFASSIMTFPFQKDPIIVILFKISPLGHELAIKLFVVFDLLKELFGQDPIAPDCLLQ